MFPNSASETRVAVSGVAALHSAAEILADDKPDSPKPKRTSLGLLTYCFELAKRASAEIPGIPNYNDPVVFIEEAARIGAGAVQIPFGVRDAEYIRRVREVAERSGVKLEATLSLPQEDPNLGKFEAEIKTVRELGISIVRTVIFPGRRYEDLHSYAAYETALDNARKRLRRSEPIAKRHKVQLAVENHKDQRIDERLKLLEEFSSEHIGVCLDVGNNISLLEDPVEVCRAFAPWTLTVHFKDQGVREYEDGFLLADLALGQGCIDLQAVIRAIREKKPKVLFQLELITRDPLKVPVLTEGYWPTFPNVKARELSASWRMIKERSAPAPFPMISTLSPAQKVAMERNNIEESLRVAAEKLGFAV